MELRNTQHKHKHKHKRMGSVVTTSSIRVSLLIPKTPAKTHQQLVSKPSLCTAQNAHLRFHPLFLPNRGKYCSFCPCALNKAKKEDTLATEMSDFEDEFDDLDDDEDDGGGDVGGDDEEEEDGLVLPFGQMQKWLESRPRGFGEGKVYDTSVEDKLMEELEQIREAQAANVNNLKSNPVPPGQPKKDSQTKKAPEVVPDGLRVRVVNLPKKKNVHRDLKSAFKEVCGIINIIPAVSGNKKTKDPICKGFAFVDFKSKEDAARFVQQFSRQSVAFGKIQKQIRCEISSTECSSSSGDVSKGSIKPAPLLIIPDVEGDLDTELDMADSSFEGNISDASDDDLDDIIELKLEDETKDIESLSTSELNGYDGSAEPSERPAASSLPLKKQGKRGGSKKKINAKVKRGKAAKLDVPGSAKRLRVKEKALLTDVFTKYGSKIPLASGKES